MKKLVVINLVNLILKVLIKKHTLSIVIKDFKLFLEHKKVLHYQCSKNVIIFIEKFDEDVIITFNFFLKCFLDFTIKQYIINICISM